MRKSHAKEHADRAKQFMPFAALRGFEELVADIARAREGKRDLLDDYKAQLDYALQSLVAGDIVTVRHYKDETYIEITGKLIEICETERKIIVDDIQISIDDIFDIGCEA